MYNILRIILAISICLIVSSVAELLYNALVKKQYKEYADCDKEDTKYIIKNLLIGIVGAIVCALFLLLKMYTN